MMVVNGKPQKIEVLGVIFSETGLSHFKVVTLYFSFTKKKCIFSISEMTFVIRRLSVIPQCAQTVKYIVHFGTYMNHVHCHNLPIS